MCTLTYVAFPQNTTRSAPGARRHREFRSAPRGGDVGVRRPDHAGVHRVLPSAAFGGEGGGGSGGWALTPRDGPPAQLPVALRQGEIPESQPSTAAATPAYPLKIAVQIIIRPFYRQRFISLANTYYTIIHYCNSTN